MAINNYVYKELITLWSLFILICTANIQTV